VGSPWHNAFLAASQRFAAKCVIRPYKNPKDQSAAAEQSITELRKFAPKSNNPDLYNSVANDLDTVRSQMQNGAMPQQQFGALNQNVVNQGASPITPSDVRGNRRRQNRTPQQYTQQQNGAQQQNAGTTLPPPPQ
jgi:hypothetical protein